MRYIVMLFLAANALFASIDNITSFQADFVQKITDDKQKTLSYKGHIKALKPQYALWQYVKPVKKEIYINELKVAIVEDELEQVIIKKLSSNIDMFRLLKTAKKISKNRYITKYNDTDFYINMQNGMIKSISYKDEFDNNVEIVFSNQKQNQKIDKTVFILNIPQDYDILRDF